jgi:hypothetical protein
MRSALMVTGNAASTARPPGGLSRGSCACAAAAQKSKAKTGANRRIGGFKVIKGKEAFFEC